jgi:hypothetical protein
MSPGDGERRPSEKAALNPNSPAKDLAVDSSQESEPIWKRLRRRREASHRMPPLASGKRDPFDLYPSDGAA